jgi:heme/copper-type cytochrome/quinol oxidase subunit 3
VTETTFTAGVPATRSRTYSTAWWGTAMVILTEGTIFLVLLAAYTYLRASAPHWPPPGVELPDAALALPFSLVLWGSSVPVLVAEERLRAGHVRAAANAVAITTLLGLAFLGFTVHDFVDLRFGWRDSAYGSAYYTIVGLHAAHVVVGLLWSLLVQAKARLGRYDAEHHASAQAFFLYWHFVDAVWVAVYGVVILGPHL